MGCSSWCQETVSVPVCRVSGVPDGVGAEEGQLAAVLGHAADLVDLQAVAQLCESCFVPCIHKPSCPNFEGDVGASEPIALDLARKVLVPLGLNKGWY